MNWKEIKYKYVGAWIEFISNNDFLEINEDKNSPRFGTLGWYFTDGVHKVKMWHIYESRNLYDFFDENGFYVDAYMGNYLDNWRYFTWTIHTCDGLIASDEVRFTVRTAAEESAFTKAFELLEERL